MPLFWLSTTFLAGIFLASYLRLPVSAWLSLAAICALIAALPRLFPGTKRRIIAFFTKFLPGFAGSLSFWDARWQAWRLRLLQPLPTFLLLAALFLGGARYQAALPALNPGHIAWYNDRDQIVTLEGVLIQPPDERDNATQLLLQGSQLGTIPGGALLPVSGKVLIQALPGGSWQYGDRVRLRGYLRTPFESENFSYREYLAQQGTYSVIKPQQIKRLATGQGNPLLAGMYALRTRAVETAYHLWPDPEASLMAGVLLGVDKGIPQPVLQAFQDTGTAHIIAISGQI